MKFNIYTSIAILFGLSSLLLTGCGEDPEPSFEIPSTYTFTDKDGNSTVNFSGQTARLNQLAEMVTYIETANTPGTALDEDQLLEMYSNNNGTGSSYFSNEANAIDKQLRNKTARGDENYIWLFESYLKEVAEKSKLTVANEYGASNGVSGVLKSGEKAYLVSEKGLDYGEIIEKGLMGAVFYDQIQNVYLAPEKMNVDNSAAVDPENGKYYTVMEHHWDEAYGYFTTATDFPTNGTDRFWGKYSNTVNGLLNSNEVISKAFILGRAAISNNDLELRDEQISIIRIELERITSGTALHYINAAISNFTDDAIRTHQLSEAISFIQTLYFSAPETTLVSATQIESALDHLRDESGDFNLYEITLEDLRNVRDDLASFLGFEEIKTEI